MDELMTHFVLTVICEVVLSALPFYTQVYLYVCVSMCVCMYVRSSLLQAGWSEHTFHYCCNESYLSASTFVALIIRLFSPDT